MKKSWIKKGIVSLIVVAIFMAPISAGIKIDKKNNLAINVEKNGARADEVPVNNTDVSLDIKETSVTFNIKLPPESVPPGEKYEVEAFLFDKISETTGRPGDNETPFKDKNIGDIGYTTTTQQFSITFDDLTTGKKYYGVIIISDDNGADPWWVILTGGTSLIFKTLFDSADHVRFQKFIPFTAGGTVVESEVQTNTYGTYGDVNFGCGITSGDEFVGCIAYAIYYIIWVPAAAIAKLAGTILDFLIYYSTDSDSYTSAFVTKAWSAVRDIANIFFIIALLYVAIKTVLGLNVTNNKKLISMVILIALIINFSLFTTKLVIDGSNILAKVFYNNITAVKENSSTAVTSIKGEKPISAGINSKFNPQEIITYPTLNKGLFIFVTLLSAALMLFMAYIFFSVALLFVGRVVSLWLSMIFSPIAFASYTVPFDIPGFGHKEWWKNLIENAMLAPLFIFFLYIIIMFGDFLKLITYDNANTDTNMKAMKTIIPFIIIFILLQKAKGLAVKYSGEIGSAITKVGAMAGGLALGAVTGGAGMLASKTIGAKALSVANNDELRAKAAAGDKGSQRKLAIANTLAKSSFDFRQTGIGKSFGKTTGMDLNKGTGVLGISTEKLKGGQKAKLEKEKEKGIERMKTYELTGAAAAKQNDLAQTAKKQNERAEQYEKDKENAKKFIKDNNGVFDEQDFKENYEKGENLKDRGYGLNKKVDAGSIESVKKIETATQINEGRRRAYANSLQEKVDKNEARGAVNMFFTEWARGMKKMATTRTGVGSTLAVGAMTGGLGAGAVIVGGGFLHALKETLGAKDIRKTNSEVIAAIRKGENPNKKLIDELKKMTEKGHSDSGKLSDIAKKMTDGEEEGEHNKGH